jgi:hypothetical protein
VDWREIELKQYYQSIVVRFQILILEQTYTEDPSRTSCNRRNVVTRK